MYKLSSLKNLILPWACIALCLAILPCCSKSTLDGNDGIDFHTDGYEDAGDVAGEDMQEDTTDPVPDAAPDLEPDIAPDLMPDIAPDPVLDPVPDIVTDLVPDLVPDPVPDPVVDPVPDPVPDFPFDIPFDRIPDFPFDRIPDRIHDRIPDRIPDWRPDRPPDIMPDPVDIMDDETCFGGIVGDPCSAASDCNCVPSSASECLESLAGFITFPGGYCTARCTSAAECGTGANCAELYPGTNYCLKECSRVWDCRMSEGYNCTTIPMSADSRTYCLPDRGADTVE